MNMTLIDRLRPPQTGVGGIHCRYCPARETGFCKNFGNDLLAATRAVAVERRFAKGDSIFAEDSDPHSVFIVKKGEFKAVRALADGRRQIIGFASEGDVFGSPFMPVAFTCGVEALTDGVLCTMRRKALAPIFQAHADFGEIFVITMTNEIRRRSDLMLLLGRKNAEERLAAFLLERRHDGIRKSAIADDSMIANLVMSRSDIGDYLGLTLETISRTFSLFKRRGLIRFNRKKSAVILDLDELQRIAGDDWVAPCGPRLFL